MSKTSESKGTHYWLLQSSRLYKSLYHYMTVYPIYLVSNIESKGTYTTRGSSKQKYWGALKGNNNALIGVQGKVIS